MRSLRLEHSPLGLLNPVWGTHSAPCCGDALCAAFVLEGRWEGLSFRLCELLRATKSCAYWVFTPQRFPPSAPHISYQWKVKTFFGHLAETMWGLTEAQKFLRVHFGRSVQWVPGTKFSGEHGPSAHGCKNCGPYETAGGTSEGVWMDRLMGICAVHWLCRALNNQIPSDHSTNWIAYDKITAFSPTLFNLHLEKNWKWHGKVRPINTNNCSLFASTILQHAVW